MSNFDINDYETVDSRIKRFYDDHPDGSITTQVIGDTVEMLAVVKATVLVAGEIRATGFAMELRDTTKAINKYGKEYESVNYTSWLENSETSAIGRALANFNYSGDKRASREEMEKVQRGGVDVITQIGQCTTLEQLKNKYDRVFKTLTSEEEKKALRTAKDMRKKELTEEAGAEEAFDRADAELKDVGL